MKMPESLRGYLRTWNEWRRVPVVMQTRSNDCGPACAVMTLARHGHLVDLDSVRRRTRPGLSGTSAKTILKVMESYGLPGLGIKAALEDLPTLPPASILFWGSDHFVVLVSADTRYVRVIDPAIGRRKLSLPTASQLYAGSALIFRGEGRLT